MTTALYPGFNAIVMGPPGSGKTHALSTLPATGLETFVLFLEPGLETLVGAYSDTNRPVPDNLHWHYLQSKQRSIEDLRKTAEMIGKFDQKALANYKDMRRSQYNQFEAIYALLNDFIDQRTGKHYGPVDEWGSDRCLVIDGLSGLGRAVMDSITGDKPLRDKPDYGLAQTSLMNFIHKVTTGCNCHFVLIAHVDRQLDEVLGGVKLMISTIGQAIKSDLAQPFSDVILAKREQATWWWDTADSGADLKTRNLPVQSKIPADFGAIFAKWQARKLAAGM